MTSEASNTAIVRRHHEAIQRGAVGEELATFYAPDVVQEELPNRFAPNGARRDLAGLKEAAARGQDLMASQSYELLTIVASGATVAVEARSTGTLARAIGPIPAGTTMKARFGQLFEFREGRIVAQRNYDCFEPW